MEGLTMGAVALGVMLLLLGCRLHVGVGMLLAGALCYLLVYGDVHALLYTLNNLVYARFSSYDLAVIPIFVLMGQFAIHGGLSATLFQASAKWIGHWRGGLAMSAAGACAGFGAICGSSLATATTMSQVALPELERHRYTKRLATGTIAAAGTLGILIPPSVPLIVYAVLTHTSIATLFMAAVLPGLVAVVGYFAVIRLMAVRSMTDVEASPRYSWAERLASLRDIAPVLVIFIVVIFGLYGGWANLTEAASLGAAACGVYALWRGMRWAGLYKSLVGTAEASAMIYLVVIGADLLNSGLALGQLPAALAEWVLGSGLAPLAVLLVILAIYLVLGCMMDSLSMILLTIPIFFPIIMQLDLFGLTGPEKAIWFGIVALMVVEIGLITPPMGMNLFIVQKYSHNTSLGTVSRGIVPFLGADMVRIAVVVFVPALSLVWLG
ncbi:TRAP transporter large permease [Larsenimonas suaedae]|uniref:TRAP transporter large permease protein n=1 Tax=Larsenimonas suaedae TaxID=1851019 RepID=A0ABU1GW36_9GAMM|nr:TRAP transporter large permease [Larsenimonas suaedae]MCM2973321.1 TRAP transporter large permease [Larsenimonas suaedae]MDR5896214.1 TRAP transporter large permease [Larsenimonas suaedae]